MEKPGDPQNDQEFHLRDYLEILTRHRGLVVLTAVMVAATIMGLALLMPKRYTGIAKVSIVESDPDVQVERSKSLLTGKSSFYETQIEILKSWPIYEEVLRRLSLEDRDLVEPYPPILWTKRLIYLVLGLEETRPTLAERILKIQEKVVINPVRDSDVVVIRAVAGEPELAAQLANTIGEVFAKRNLSFKREKSSGDRVYLSERLGITKEDLIDSENELRRFEEEKDTVSLQVRIEYLTELRIKGDGELADVERRIEEVSARLKPLLSQLGRARKGVAQAATEAYAGLQQRVLDLRLRRTALLKAFTAEHPEVRSIEQELALVQRDVREAESALLAGESGSVSGMDKVLSQYNELLQELEGLRAQEGSLRKLLEHYKLRLKEDLALKSQYDFLRREVDANRKIYDLLLIRQKEASLKEDMQISDVRVIEPAVVPLEPSSPKLLIALIVAILGGIGMGIFAAFFRHYMDNTIRSGKEIERDFGLNCLVTLPFVPELARSGKRNVDLVGESKLADAVALLSLSRELGTPEDPAAVYLITSSGPSEGKTTVASHLAVSFALGGERTVVIDCDLRRPRIINAFGLEDGRPGIRDMLGNLDGLDVLLDTLPDCPNLCVAGSRVPDPAPLQLIGQQPFAKLLMRLRTHFDKVVLDSPPVNAVADPLYLAPLADRIVVVSRAEKTTRPAFEHAIRSLREVRGSLAGVVVNGVKPSSVGYSGYYGYYGYADYGTLGTVPRGESAAKPGERAGPQRLEGQG